VPMTSISRPQQQTVLIIFASMFFDLPGKDSSSSRWGPQHVAVASTASGATCWLCVPFDSFIDTYLFELWC
jgi:hypothetical protein